MIDFSMGLARDGAWKFANELTGKTKITQQELIAKRDEAIAQITKLVNHQGLFLRVAFFIIKLGEKGDASYKIKALKKMMEKSQP